MTAFFSHRAPRLKPFAENATVLLTDVKNADRLAHDLGPTQLISFQRSHVDKQSAIIRANQGHIAQFVGSAIVAFWRSDNHALRAVDTARKLLHACDGRIDVTVSIATENLIGDVFGPTRQFQVLGKALDQANRIWHAHSSDRLTLFVTEQTLQQAQLSEGQYTPVGELKGEGGVFSLSGFLHAAG